MVVPVASAALAVGSARDARSPPRKPIPGIDFRPRPPGPLAARPGDRDRGAAGAGADVRCDPAHGNRASGLRRCRRCDLRHGDGDCRSPGAGSAAGGDRGEGAQGQGPRARTTPRQEDHGGRNPEGGLRDPEGEPRRGGGAQDRRRIGAPLGDPLLALGQTVLSELGISLDAGIERHRAVDRDPAVRIPGIDDDEQ